MDIPTPGQTSIKREILVDEAYLIKMIDDHDRLTAENQVLLQKVKCLVDEAENLRAQNKRLYQAIGRIGGGSNC